MQRVHVIALIAGQLCSGGTREPLILHDDETSWMGPTDERIAAAVKVATKIVRASEAAVERGEA